MHRSLMRILGLAAACAAAGTLELGSPAGPPVDGAGLSGTVLPIWGTRDKYRRLAEGLRRGGFSHFRYPNGTLSNEYHWNGAGEYDSLGIWRPDSVRWAPGFLADLRHRGTTRDNYGSTFPSQVFDGDTSSFWWGNGSAEAPPWFVIDFRAGVRLDSLEMDWGGTPPRVVRVEAFRGGDDHGQGPHTAMEGSWNAVGRSGVTGPRTALRLKSDSARYLALRFEGIAPSGVRLREVRAFARGQPLTRNVPLVREQTRGVGLGTAPSSERKAAWQPRDWDFETFMATLRAEWPGAQPLITVNLGTGTPEEAAAWVRYANVQRGYGIRRWMVGNEQDGDWEDGGPLDAAQMAERFLSFARAMKAQDSSIEVMGPVFASLDWNWGGSGFLDGRTWMEAFLERVGAAERRDGRRWLDVVDFHAYPYWWPEGVLPDSVSMLRAADRLGSSLDTLRAMMGRTLPDPATRGVSISEYNASVKVSHLVLAQPDGALVALMLGHLASRFGDRASSSLWEVAGGEPMNPDGSSTGTYGSLRIFTPPRRGLVSDLGDPPTGAFWGQFLANLWMGSARDSLAPVPARLSGAPDIRAFALGKGAARSVLLVNLADRPDTVRFDGFPAGEVFHWGRDQYLWDGTGSQARAFPNAGPVATPWDGEPVAVPPLGVAIVRAGFAARPAPVRQIHRVATSRVLRETDTLGVCWSLAQDDGALDTAVWSLDGGRERPLAAMDGAWDASREAACLERPVAPWGRGTHRLVLRASGRASRLADTVDFEVAGQPRVVAWFDRFEEPEPSWSPYVHKLHGGSSLRISHEEQLDTTGGNGRFLDLAFAIAQPGDLGYPNFVTAGRELDLGTRASVRPVGVVFDYAAQYESGSGVFSLYLLSSLVRDYDHHRVVLPSTGGRWKRDTVWFDALAQEGWGTPLGPLDPATVIRVELRAQGAGTGELKFDDFALIGTEGEPIALPPLPASPRRRGR